jgi:4-diphosphocytidyl-2-C-methyl-D-erythritol kinase
MNSVTLPARAKLNLYLDIVGKRDDGYHNIVTEMQEIDLADTVTVTLKETGIRVTCDNPALPTDNRNIAYRAAELFHTGSEIHIEKRIPVMAGLGGSSADGAAVLKGLNQLHKRFTEIELLKIGARLGADVPFCLTGGRAKCEGIGDIITPLPDLPGQFYLIVRSDFCCDTKFAYSLYKPDIKRTKPNIFQDLYKDERIERICDELLRLGARTASMTGSGSAVFGVFGSYEQAESALNNVNYPFKIITNNTRRNTV